MILPRCYVPSSFLGWEYTRAQYGSFMFSFFLLLSRRLIIHHNFLPPTAIIVQEIMGTQSFAEFAIAAAAVFSALPEFHVDGAWCSRSGSSCPSGYSLLDGISMGSNTPWLGMCENICSNAGYSISQNNGECPSCSSSGGSLTTSAPVSTCYTESGPGAHFKASDMLTMKFCEDGKDCITSSACSSGVCKGGRVGVDFYTLGVCAGETCKPEECAYCTSLRDALGAFEVSHAGTCRECIPGYSLRGRVFLPQQNQFDNSHVYCAKDTPTSSPSCADNSPSGWRDNDGNELSCATLKAWGYCSPDRFQRGPNLILPFPEQGSGPIRDYCQATCGVCIPDDPTTTTAPDDPTTTTTSSPNLPPSPQHSVPAVPPPPYYRPPHPSVTHWNHYWRDMCPHLGWWMFFLGGFEEVEE